MVYINTKIIQMIAYLRVFEQIDFPLYFGDFSQNAELLLALKKTFNMK